MVKVGIRKLKNALSRYVRRAEAGERVLVTDRGRVVAELVPAGTGQPTARSRYDELVAAGVIRRAPAPGADPLRDLHRLRLPRGTAARWIAEDRGER
jgi:prevent-host-death family protein